MNWPKQESLTIESPLEVETIVKKLKAITRGEMFIPIFRKPLIGSLNQYKFDLRLGDQEFYSSPTSPRAIGSIRRAPSGGSVLILTIQPAASKIGQLASMAFLVVLILMVTITTITQIAYIARGQIFWFFIVWIVIASTFALCIGRWVLPFGYSRECLLLVSRISSAVDGKIILISD